MTLPKITKSLIRADAEPESFARGKDDYQEGAISNATIQSNLFRCESCTNL